MRTEEFFERVESGGLSKLDIHNHIQQLTDDYDEDKLNLLCKEFDSYIFEKYEHWIASYSQNKIDKIVAKWGDKGRELPAITDEKYKSKWLYVRSFFGKTRWGKPISDEEYELSMKELFGDDHIPNSHVLDVNVLLGGFYYKPENFNMKTKSFPLMDLRDILIDLKRKHTSSVYRFNDKLSTQKNENPTDDLNYSSKGISFSVLNKIIYLTDYWHDSDKSVINKLLDRETTDFWELEKQFDRELQRNIVLTQSDSSLKKLVKHYLFELNDLFEAPYFTDNAFGYTLTNDNHKERFRKYLFKTNQDEGYKKADRHENYIIARYSLLEIILNQLEVVILKTGLSLDDLFKEMKVSFPVQAGFIQQFNLFKIVRQAITQESQSESYQYISWLKSPESLMQFIEALQEHNLIETRKTEAIINNHFKPHREQDSKPEPIEWLKTIALLAYMIESLDQQYIKPENIWSDTAPHFTKNGKTPENLRQTANRFKQNKSRKPKNHKIIDQIIQSLAE